MKRYTYKIWFTNKEKIEFKDCDMRINWETINTTCFFQFNTPKGTMTVNMNHVILIDEIIIEKIVNKQ